MSTLVIPFVRAKSWLTKSWLAKSRFVKSSPRPKYFLWSIVGLMLGYVLFHDESFLVHSKDPMWQHYEPFKWWLLPHGIAGACALLLGPMQFSDRLRSRFRQLHRVVGRIYVAGVFVAAPLGFYIQYFEEHMGNPRSFTIAAAVDASLWMITTGLGLVFILKGKVQEHRQWMTRSFAMALVFLEVRVIGGLGGWEDFDIHANETIVWFCLAFAILSADLLLQWQQLGRSTSAVRRHSLDTPDGSLNTLAFQRLDTVHKQRPGEAR